MGKQFRVSNEETKINRTRRYFRKKSCDNNACPLHNKKNVLITLIVQIKWNLLECFMVKCPDRTIYNLATCNVKMQTISVFFGGCHVWWCGLCSQPSVYQLTKSTQFAPGFLIDNTCMSHFICKHFHFACVALICPCFGGDDDDDDIIQYGRSGKHFQLHLL